MAIAPGTVSGQTAELEIQTRLTHAGPTAENVTIELRATDLESGLLETTTTVQVDPIEGDREVTVNGTIRVARDGGYRIEAIVYQDGRRIEAWRRFGDHENTPVLLIRISHRDELGVIRESGAERLPNPFCVMGGAVGAGCQDRDD
jgi:hypothetical protein